MEHSVNEEVFKAHANEAYLTKEKDIVTEEQNTIVVKNKTLVERVRKILKNRGNEDE